MPITNKKILENKSLIGYKILSFLNIKKYNIDHSIINKDNKLSQLSDYQTVINYISKQVEVSEYNHKEEKVKLKTILLSVLNKFAPLYNEQISHGKYDLAVSSLVNKQMSDFENQMMSMEVDENLVELLKEKSIRIKRILDHAKNEREKLISQQQERISAMQQEINLLKEKIESKNNKKENKYFNVAAVIAINEVDIIDKEQHPELHEYILNYVADIIKKMQSKFPYIIIENDSLKEYLLLFDGVTNDVAYKITSEFKARLNNIKIKYRDENQKLSTTGGFFHSKEKMEKEIIKKEAFNILKEAKIKNEGSIMKNVIV